MRRSYYTLLALAGLWACGAVGTTCLPVWGTPETVPSAAPLVERDTTSAPEAWGGQVVARPVAARPQTPASPPGLVPLPPLHTTSRLPQARVRLAHGRVNLRQARTLLGASPVYTIKAQTPGIVEYLYPDNGVIKAGENVVRLYDLAILPDLRVAESAMSRFLQGPYVISAQPRSLPPVPPASDFPKPMVWQRLLGLGHGTSETSAPRSATRPAAGSSPAQQATLAPVTGLAPATASDSDRPAARAPEVTTSPEAQVSTPANSEAAAKVKSELAQAAGRVDELGALMAAAENEVNSLTTRLQQAQQDLTAREQLYEQGVLARNVLETAQERVSDLQRQLARARSEQKRVREQRETALKHRANLQDEADRLPAAVTRSDKPAAAAPAARPRPATPGRSQAAQPVTAVANAGTARTGGHPSAAAAMPPESLAGFPAPTTQPRQHLASLPRQPAELGTTTPRSNLPAVPEEARHLSAPRWDELTAPLSGTVTRQLVAPGAQVEAGTPLLEVLSRDFGRLYTDVPLTALSSFPEGALVEITFEEYPGVVLKGWVNDRQPLKKTSLARVELIAVCQRGYYPGETAQTLQWLALAAPLAPGHELPEPLLPTASASLYKKPPIYRVLPLVPESLLPDDLTGSADSSTTARAPAAAEEFVGLLYLGESETSQNAMASNTAQAQRLASLRQWREQFTSGMTTTVFGDLPLTYPHSGEIKTAIERMATCRVSHDPNRCARTLREALGWGLGDAAQWLQRLPQRGYKPRPDGLARPGDILVWPFTYGSRRTQHIGVAVSQSGRLMLLSNLSGTLGTTELVPGYVAFYKPEPTEAPTTPPSP